MNNVFLGKPPASIEAWIKSHRPTPPVACKALCFTAQEPNSTVLLQRIEGEYKFSNDGQHWTDYALGTTITLPNIGDKVYFSAKTTNDTVNHYNEQGYHPCVMTGKIAASGNIQSLLDETCQQTWVPYGCYFMMFSNCASLTQAPELPATTLAEMCYGYMFEKCTSLTQAPALPATILANNCYQNMFDHCASLTQAPELPATTLTNGCYLKMFRACTSLTQAPDLPATTYANISYRSMFEGCTSLTYGPKIWKSAPGDFMENMFWDCISLQELTIKDAPVGAVIGNAHVWGLGFPARQVIVVQCSNGFVVLNDRSQSSDGQK